MAPPLLFERGDGDGMGSPNVYYGCDTNACLSLTSFICYLSQRITQIKKFVLFFKVDSKAKEIASQ